MFLIAWIVVCVLDAFFFHNFFLPSSKIVFESREHERRNAELHTQQVSRVPRSSASRWRCKYRRWIFSTPSSTMERKWRVYNNWTTVRKINTTKHYNLNLRRRRISVGFSFASFAVAFKRLIYFTKRQSRYFFVFSTLRLRCLSILGGFCFDGESG